MLSYIILVCAVISSASATLGVDVSQAVSEADFHCLKNRQYIFHVNNEKNHLYSGNGFSFVIARVFEEAGHVDPSDAQTIKNAYTAGIEYVDGHIFPCLRCGNPSTQVRDTVNHLHSSGKALLMIVFIYSNSDGSPFLI